MSDQLFKNRNKPLRRNYKPRFERVKVLIVCEDSKSSVLYFQNICKEYRIDGKVRVDGDSESAPISVVEYAIKLVCEKDAKYDVAFCVIDRDTHATFDQAVDKVQRWRTPRGKTTKLQTIASYPWYELWILLHFEYFAKPCPTLADLKPHLNKKLSEKNLPKYDKSTSDLFSALFPLTEIAQKNAQNLDIENNKTDSKNPSTKIHILIDEMQKIRDRVLWSNHK